MILLLWACAFTTLISVAVNTRYRLVTVELLVTAVAILAAIMVAVGMRHLPSTGPVLRKFVALILLMILLFGGFYERATLARDGSLWRMTGDLFDREVHGSSPMPSIAAVLSLPATMTVHASGEWMSEKLPYLLIFSNPYACMISPCFLLLMVVTPRFLAMPVSWLWVVFSVRYVVLPSRAWKWTGDVLQRAWSVFRNRRSM